MSGTHSLTNSKRHCQKKWPSNGASSAWMTSSEQPLSHRRSMSTYRLISTLVAVNCRRCSAEASWPHPRRRRSSSRRTTKIASLLTSSAPSFRWPHPHNTPTASSLPMVSELVHNTTQHCMSIWNNLGTLQESFSELWRWILLIFAGALTSRCSGRDHVRGRRHQRLARRTERRVFPRDRAAGSRTASSAPWSKTTRRGGGSTDCRDAAALQFPFLFPNCTCRLQFSLHCLFAGSCTVLQWDIITNKMKNLKKKRRT